MAFIENFLAPLFQVVIIFIFLILIVIGIYFLMIKYFSKQLLQIRLGIKYKLLKKSYNEKMVKWCLDMIDRKVKDIDLEKEFYITNQFKLGQFQEGYYIYKKIKKIQGVKGGK